MRKPGFPPGVHLKGGRNAAPVLAQMAREFYAPIIPVAAELRQEGLSLRAIARELERRGITPRFGFPNWSAAQVRRMLLRADSDRAAAAAAPKASWSDDPETRADIRLFVGGRSHGPFNKVEVRQMLEAGRITLETTCVSPILSPRPVRELLDPAGHGRASTPTPR